MAGPAPLDPFRLLVHLTDDHEIDGHGLDRMEGDDLRRLHRSIHEQGGADHDHTTG